MNRLISIAPMMDCTDRHDRFFLRLIAPHVVLYTEMITTGALIHGDANRFLAFDPIEHPVVLQLGGNSPNELAKCAKMGEEFGYDEINLNVGCPSSRVNAGRFGASLMLDPKHVAECITAMLALVKIPVTVKCRIGVDDHDSYEFLSHFIQTIADAGCKIFIIHARKAWLTGLSPKENRDIPPLRYDVVHRIKKDFPHLTIIINGGIKTLVSIKEQLSCVDGVMIGREAYSNPYFLSQIEKEMYASDSLSREEVVEKFIDYMEEQLKYNVRLSAMTRHVLGLYQHQKGARQWRRYISEQAHREDVGAVILKNALAASMLPK